MAEPGEGIARMKLSERGLYAFTRGCRRRAMRMEREEGREKNIAVLVSK
jgi:hypothetical protein